MMDFIYTPKKSGSEPLKMFDQCLLSLTNPSNYKSKLISFSMIEDDLVNKLARKFYYLWKKNKIKLFEIPDSRNYEYWNSLATESYYHITYFNSLVSDTKLIEILFYLKLL